MTIAGAGGHAREIRDILDLQGVRDIWFFDNISAPLPKEMRNEKVIRDETLLAVHLKNKPEFIVGTGKPEIRKILFDLFISLGGKPESCVAPTATLSSHSVKIDPGCNIMQRAFISNHVHIGLGALINAGAMVHHDVVIGDFCEVGPGAILLGNVKVGAAAFVGAGAIILPGISIGVGAVVGAGAVVTKNVEAGKKVKGNPAK